MAKYSRTTSNYVNMAVAPLIKVSPTLFGRGTHAQVGAMHREPAELRALMTEVKAIPEIVNELKQMVLDMKGRLDAMNIPELVPQVKHGQLGELERKNEAPQVTTASLQALERRIDAKIQASASSLIGQVVCTSRTILCIIYI
jgi:hypothetical protein